MDKVDKASEQHPKERARINLSVYRIIVCPPISGTTWLQSSNATVTRTGRAKCTCHIIRDKDLHTEREACIRRASLNVDAFWAM